MVGWFWLWCVATLALAVATGRRWVLLLPAFGAVALVSLVAAQEPDKLQIALVGTTLYGSLLTAVTLLAIQLRRRVVSPTP